MFHLPASGISLLDAILVVAATCAIAALILQASRSRPPPETATAGLRQTVPWLAALVLAVAALVYLPAVPVGRFGR
jgi:hypothetical protein